MKERIKNLPNEVKEGTHWNEEATIRRFQSYAKYNEDGTPQSFFEGKVDIKKIEFNYEGAEQFANFVERVYFDIILEWSSWFQEETARITTKRRTSRKGRRRSQIGRERERERDRDRESF